MLELLGEKCKENKIANIKIIKDDLENITKDNVGSHDIVLSSRSLNGIIPIKKTLVHLNEIANKYVYITLFGPNNRKFEKEFYKTINKEYDEFAPYSFLFNILVNMGIYPNIENLEIKSKKSYNSIQEAIDNGRWRLDTFTEDEKSKLYEYLKNNLIENSSGKLENLDDKADWVLIWWKK